MRCDEVTALLPGLVDGDVDVDDDASATSRRACAARPSSPATAACCGRSRCCGPATPSRRPGLLGETLAALTDAAEEGARRTLLSGRRLAYAGAIGGTAVAAGRDGRAPDRPLPQAVAAPRRAEPGPAAVPAAPRSAGERRCYPRVGPAPVPGGQ